MNRIVTTLDQQLCRDQSGNQKTNLDQSRQSILLYARKSDDVVDVLEGLKNMITYIRLKQSRGKQTFVSFIYMEQWALQALHDSGSLKEVQFTEVTSNENEPSSDSIVFLEWLPE